VLPVAARRWVSTDNTLYLMMTDQVDMTQKLK